MTSGDADASARLMSQYVQRSLDPERAQYERLESRAATIVTTTGGLVTVIGAVAAFVPGDQRSTAFSIPSLVLLLVALALFTGAVLLAQGSVLAARHAVPVVNGQFPGFDADERELLQGVAYVDLTLMKIYRKAGLHRTRFLNWATVCQMLAIVALTAAVSIVLVGLL
jgi:hypothetical protein